MPIFTRFTEIISKKKPKRIVNITVKPVVTDCTGKFWFTDLMFQEGTQLSEYVINTETMLKNYATDDEYTYKGVTGHNVTDYIETYLVSAGFLIDDEFDGFGMFVFMLSNENTGEGIKVSYFQSDKTLILTLIRG